MLLYPVILNCLFFPVNLVALVNRQKKIVAIKFYEIGKIDHLSNPMNDDDDNKKKTNMKTTDHPTF